MRVTKSQFKALYEALNRAFTTNESLEELARIAHNETLDQITTGPNTKSKIQGMIKRSEEEHWLGDLLRAAYELRPRDEKLTQLYQDFQVGTVSEQKEIPSSHFNPVDYKLKQEEL